ncbi:MAG TPA: hypothetical protein VMX55_15300 [candidate division Zixibacteria bacterium]|nr:hypothetical protein [candidate division Zixibacteria bacterium]
MSLITNIQICKNILDCFYTSNVIPIVINDSENNFLSFSSLTLNDAILSILSGIVGLYLLVILLLLKSRYPNWIVRKIVHFSGGTYIAFIAFQFDNILGILLAICLFSMIFLTLIIFSKGKIISEYFLLNFREGEKNYTFIVNTTFTLVILLISLLVFNNNPAIFTAGALVISWADTFGEVSGKLFPIIKYRVFNKKSLSGSFSVFFFSVLAFVITILFYKISFSPFTIWKILIGSILCSLFEAISWKWLDNLILPFIGNLVMFWIIFSI